MVNSIGLLGMSLGDANKAIKKLPYGPIRIVFCSKQVHSLFDAFIIVIKHIVWYICNSNFKMSLGLKSDSVKCIVVRHKYSAP